MPSLSDRSSARFLVPSTFLRVVCASSRVDEWALNTLATAEMGQYTRKYTTPSTFTLTESLVRIYRCFQEKTAVSLMAACDAHNSRLAGVLCEHLPLEGEFQRTQFSDQLSQSYQCKVILRKVLERNKRQFRSSTAGFCGFPSVFNKPGPLAFLSAMRPSLKMTARSYSFTIWVSETTSARKQRRK